MTNHGSLIVELVVTTAEKEQEYGTDKRRQMASQYKWRMERIWDKSKKE